MPSVKHQYRQRKRRTFHPPQLFWDKLSKLWLTKSALREVNRRNKLLSPVRTSISSPRIFAPEFLRNCSATCLQEIRKLSRYGGPDLSDIRNYPPPAHFCQYSMDPTSPSSKRPATTHTKTPNTTVYDRHFEDHLTQHGVFMPLSRYLDGTKLSRPKNFTEIQSRLRAPRPSLALSEGSLERAYEEFVELNEDAVDEQAVIAQILPILEGKDRSKIAGGHPFKNLAPLTDGTLANAKPDLYHGARTNQLEPAIQKQLENQIMPSNQSNRLVAPNFFIEAKGHWGSVPVVKRQVCYDGTLGARGMRSLQQFGDESESRHDEKAYTMMSTYHAGTLGIYATHPTKSRNKDRHTDFVMTQIGHYSLIGSPESYQHGLNAYRNSRDLAKEYRDDLIGRANERYAAGKDNEVKADESKA